MNVDDMIFVSVDDHVVEPPDMFDGRMPAKYADLAPKIVRNSSGDDVWEFDGNKIPNIGLNAVAGRPKEEYGVDPTSYDEMRPGCFDVHERVKDMSAGGVLASMNFPSFPSFSGRLFLGTEDKDMASAVVRAYNDWHIEGWCGAYPDRFIPMAIPMLWDPELTAQEIRRVSEMGCHSLTFTENPSTLGLPSFHSDYWDPMWKAIVDTDTILNIHLGSSGQLAITAPDAPIDVMITLQPLNICQAAADLLWSRVFKEYPTLRVRPLRGWHRLDPVLHGPPRPHLRHAPGVDRSGLRLQGAERDLPRALHDLLHRRPHRPAAAQRDRHREHVLGDGLPPLRLVVALRPRGVRDGGDEVRRHRRGDRQDHPRERHEVVPVRPLRHPAREKCTVAALRAEVEGHDVSEKSYDTGRFEKSSPDLGELQANATA